MASKKHRVLLIHNILWSHYKATVFSELYRLCNEQELAFFVLQIANTLQDQTVLESADLSIHRYPYRLLFPGVYEDTSVGQRFLGIVAEVKRFRPSICILPGWADPLIFLLTPYLKLRGIRIIQTVDTIETANHTSRLKEWSKRLLLVPTELVYTYGVLGEAYLRKLGVSSEKIQRRVQATDNETIVGRVDPDLPKQDPPAFLYVGRLVKAKGVHDLINAYKKLRTEWQLTIVGDGPERPALEELACEDSRIQFVGPKAWDEVGSYYKQSAVFVLPSHADIWGLVVNEAMLFGLPVIVTDRCGCHADLVEEGRNGMVVPAQDMEAMWAAMLLFTEKQVDRQAYGQRSLEIIKSFTPGRSAAQMMAGLQKVLE